MRRLLRTGRFRAVHSHTTHIVRLKFQPYYWSGLLCGCRHVQQCQSDRPMPSRQVFSPHSSWCCRFRFYAGHRQCRHSVFQETLIIVSVTKDTSDMRMKAMSMRQNAGRARPTRILVRHSTRLTRSAPSVRTHGMTTGYCGRNRRRCVVCAHATHH